MLNVRKKFTRSFPQRRKYPHILPIQEIFSSVKIKLNPLITWGKMDLGYYIEIL